jgi:uncharacterized ion transporter superfamily protein YfcC
LLRLFFVLLVLFLMYIVVDARVIKQKNKEASRKKQKQRQQKKTKNKAEKQRSKKTEKQGKHNKM